MRDSRNQRRQGTAPLLALNLTKKLSSLHCFSSCCCTFQGPEGPVGGRGLRGLQVGNTLIFNHSIIMSLLFVIPCSKEYMFFTTHLSRIENNAEHCLRKQKLCVFWSVCFWRMNYTTTKIIQICRM